MGNFTKMSEDYRHILADERAKAEDGHIARILAKKKMKTSLRPQEPADSALSQSSANLATSSTDLKVLETPTVIAGIPHNVR